MRGTTILWRRLDIPGLEVAELAAGRGGWRLSGVALLAHEGRPCRLDYEIACDATWQTRTVTIHGALGEVSKALELSQSAEHAWHANGALVPQLQGCVDVDLGFSPSTNLLPIRRLKLAIGARASVRAAWVRFPELTLEVLEQVYTRLGERTYLYESAGGAFRRELTVNESGFVVDYPDFWRAEAEVTI
ncbi:MAG: putative glycolipid-binding domain-containing protein [Gemmatimonadota bacterium]|nr:putative glycolipid-binding domain-containing protein [Gemmatimonadota bacterium]